MTSGTDSPRQRPGRASVTVWRLGTPLVLGLCAVLVITSAANSDGTDLRPGRYTDLAAVVRAEDREVQQLQDRVSELSDEVDGLGRARGDRSAQRFRDAAAAAATPAGLSPRTGEGLEITLADAPEEVFEVSEEDPNRLVVHQQDIQAVVNALWRGGAEAVTLQGQRIVSTTGIKCAGSSVQLQGRTYPQPYVIGAVGDTDALLDSLEGDDFVSLFREDAARPDIALGFDVDLDDSLTAPAYDGLLDLSYAEPMD
ncbi:DUF881 domain-containing protein [Nocardioides lentus]|uniref:DUF881 domain-containing protein n=1 Tax=Nocardioides lentus TaxID=338077 RepID=A0ABN2NXP0_9ACTN